MEYTHHDRLLTACETLPKGEPIVVRFTGFKRGMVLAESGKDYQYCRELCGDKVELPAPKESGLLRISYAGDADPIELPPIEVTVLDDCVVLKPSLVNFSKAVESLQNENKALNEQIEDLAEQVNCLEKKIASMYEGYDIV